jgi:transposase
MQTVADRPEAPNAIRNDLVAIFVSLELSRSTWLITSLSPDGGEKMSKHSVPAGDIYALLTRFSEFKQRAFCADWEIVPDHRHSGSGIGRLLDSPCVAE